MNRETYKDGGENDLRTNRKSLFVGTLQGVLESPDITQKDKVRGYHGPVLSIMSPDKHITTKLERRRSNIQVFLIKFRVRKWRYEGRSSCHGSGSSLLLTLLFD